MGRQGLGSVYNQTRDFTFTSNSHKSDEKVPGSPCKVAPNAVIQISSFPGNSVYGTDFSTLNDLESFKKLAVREKFILSQVFQVAERYCSKNNNAVSIHRNGDFVVIRDFPLPFKGDWAGRSATICFYFPQNYPSQPPVGYFIDANLRHRDNGGENHLLSRGVYQGPREFFEKHKLDRKGYGFFCWHVEKNWRPNMNNPLQPDNLNSFLRSASLSLDSRAVNQVRHIGEIY